MILPAITPHSLLSSNHNSLVLWPPFSISKQAVPPLKPLNASSSLSTVSTSSGGVHHAAHKPSECEPEGEEGGGDGNSMVSSAAAVASAIREASSSPVGFVQTMEKDQHKNKLVMPSPDFRRLCVEQLDLFRRIVHPNAVISVYVRPAGSYVMDRLELRRVACYPGVSASDIVILVGTFSIPAGLRAAETALSSQQVEVVSKHRAVVFPMVKHPFVVGFLVAEISESSEKHFPSSDKAYALPPSTNVMSHEFQFDSVDGEGSRFLVFTREQKLNAINISRSLAMAYVMDQKSMLLQQSSWQNNVRMSNLVEQIRGPLSSIRTLSKMLSVHTKRSEISYDIVKDILVQSDRMRDTLQELQNAVYLTKANIVRYNEETLQKMSNAHNAHQLLDYFPSEDNSDELQNVGEQLFLNSGSTDLEMPMPPLALAPLQRNGIRPCNVSDVLLDLVEAMRPLAIKQQWVAELSTHPQPLLVAVEEPALRQSLSNLIEGALLRTHVGEKVIIVSTAAPAGGALVVIDDEGPDMHYMTQMHSLTPYGSELFSDNKVADNMTWNFVAGLTVAREILEGYGCVVRVISPRRADAALGAGGTRIEIWLPSLTALTEANGIEC